MVVVTVSVLAYLGFKRLNASLTSRPVVAANAVPCDQLEHTQIHYHAVLQILDHGNQVPIPTGIGRTSTCFYWLHMHNGEPGIIHVEAPLARTFTLGDFFQVWSMWSGEKQLIDSTHVSTLRAAGDERLAVFVDKGSGPAPYGADPGDIVLAEHEAITIEVGPPPASAPPAYSWPPGF